MIAGVRHGGLFRCCIKTVNERAETLSIGQRFYCRYCGEAMKVASDNVAEWANREPLGGDSALEQLPIQSHIEALERMHLVKDAMAELRASMLAGINYGFYEEYKLASKAERECRRLTKYLTDLVPR